LQCLAADLFQMIATWSVVSRGHQLHLQSVAVNVQV